jgi:hypothetical protein
MNHECCVRQSVRPTCTFIYWLGCALIVVGSGWAPGACAGTIVIDSFQHPDPSQFFVVGGGTNPSKVMSQISSGAIGGQRDALINVYGHASPTAAVGLIGYDTDYAIHALQIGTNGLAPTVTTLQYSGINLANTSTNLANANALGGGLGVDLTGGGTNNRFLVHFISSDAQPTVGLDLKVKITSPGGKSSTAVATAPNAQSAFDVLIPFNSLIGNASTTQVESITFVFNELNKAANIDFEVQMLAAVPEPASAALLASGLGLLALTGFAARRRRSASLAARTN